MMWPFRRKRNYSRVQAHEVFARRLMARYDAAQTTIETEKWWSLADSLGPNASARREIRKKIRERARYEVHQGNSYARGIVAAKTNDVIGTGPVLQLKTSSESFNRETEAIWNDWAEEICLAEKLRTMHVAKQVDGESFAELITNSNLVSPVKLDLRLSEADLWTDPSLEFGFRERSVDGIEYDESWVPIRYKRLKEHPGESWLSGMSGETQTIPAEFVIHWWRIDRPDQRRGISELATGLRLFADLRRYTLAVIAAAETAAEFAAVVKADANAFQEVDFDPEVLESWLTVPIQRRMMLSLPVGYDIQQLKAEQPTTSYSEFVDKIVQEIARSFQVPLNIAIGSSKEHNFASATLDYRLFHLANDVERQECKCRVLNPIFNAFLAELGPARSAASSVTGIVPHAWHFPKRAPINELDHANAQKALFEIGHLLDEDVFAEMAVDPERQYESMERMWERRTAIGAPLPGGGGMQEATPVNDGQEAAA
jgi:hypothetical protein